MHDVNPKYMYLARRNPKLDRPAFVERWRAHGALAMHTPRWKYIRRYAQCDVVLEAGTIGGISNDYDGIGIVWPRSLAARQAYRSEHESQSILERDELETFDRPVLRCSVLCDERVPMKPAGGRLKLVRFLFTPDTALASPFKESWSAHAMAVSGMSAKWGLRGYVQNHPMPTEQASGWGLPVAGIEELWFDDLEGIRLAQSWFLGDHASTTPAPAWHHAVAVVATETVLHDAP